MLYKVTVGQDVYVGTPEEVVLWMSRAEGAPAGGPDAFMRGVARRVLAQTRHRGIDPSSPLAFLESLAEAHLVRLERRSESSTERVDAQAVLGDGPLAFGADVSLEDLERDVLGKGGDDGDEGED